MLIHLTTPPWENVMNRSVRRVYRKPDEQGCQHRENVGLKKGHEQLQHDDAQSQRHRHEAHHQALEDEDHPQERQDGDVASRHVGEKTDTERERLDEHPQHLDHDHDRQDEDGKAVRHQVLPVLEETVLPDSLELDHQEGENRQTRRHVEVAGGRRAERHQPEQVADQDEKEKRQDVRSQFSSMVLADVLDADLVAHEHDQHLEQVHDPPGHELPPTHHHGEQQDEYRRGDPHHHDMPRDGQIEPAEVDLRQVDLGESQIEGVPVRDVVHDRGADVVGVLGRVLGCPSCLRRVLRRLLYHVSFLRYATSSAWNTSVPTTSPAPTPAGSTTFSATAAITRAR